ncbi:acyltransferase family protein [Streptomyces sp. NPDC059009]|uniref:acyltransferase family protein n=1 Tax=Streptomyces sp. NPDC059009 TaxID=3346694 RepID=UPI0036B25B4B
MTSTAPATRSRPTPTTTGTPAERSQARDPFFDNAKFLLIVLVVAGHSWSPLQAQIPAVKAAYTVVYLFHMPAFIVICGYFARHFCGTGPQMRALLTKVLLPYLLFQTAYQALDLWISGGPFQIHPIQPTYVLWFLPALCLWRVSVPLWTAVRRPLLLAVAVSLAAGTTQMSYDLALPRVLMFLPWFVLGLRLRPEHLARLRTPALRGVAGGVLLAALAGAYWLAPGVDPDWFNMQYSYEELGSSMPAYLGLRVVLFALSGLLVAAFFALVPDRRTRYTALGAVTMFPFLAHGLVIQTAERLDLDGLAGRLGASAAPVLALFALGLALLLSSRPVRLLLRPFVEPGTRNA